MHRMILGHNTLNSIGKSRVHSRIGARFEVLSDDPQQSIDDYLNSIRFPFEFAFPGRDSYTDVHVHVFSSSTNMSVSVPTQLYKPPKDIFPECFCRHTVCHFLISTLLWLPTNKVRKPAGIRVTPGGAGISSFRRNPPLAHHETKTNYDTSEGSVWRLYFPISKARENEGFRH
jgi:hypothetical protein